MDFYKDYTSTQALGGQDERVQLRVAADNTRANLVPLLPSDRNAKIVDVACGYGRYLKALRDLGYTDTLGIDLSAEQIAFARDRLGLACASQGDGLVHLQTHPAEYDAILLLDILEHLPAETTIDWLKAAHAALRPGGVVLVQVPNGMTPFSVHFHGDLTHKRAYSAPMLAQSFRLAGLESFSIHASFDAPTRLVGILRHVLWRWALNPLLGFLTKCAYGTSAGGIFTANLLAQAKNDRVELGLGSLKPPISIS